MHSRHLVAVGREPSGTSQPKTLNHYRAARAAPLPISRVARAAPLRTSSYLLNWHICGLLFSAMLLSGCGPAATNSAVTQAPTQTPPGDKSHQAKVTTPPSPPEATPMRLTDDAFRFAAYEGKVEAVREGIKAGNNVNSTDPEKRLTPLHMAAYNGHVEVIKLLLEHGATLDARDSEGKTPLLHASTGPYADALKVLIDAGADVNAAETTEAFTPLMMAAGLGQTEVVKVLLAHKANRDLLDNDGDSALKHAQNSGHVDIVELLKQ